MGDLDRVLNRLDSIGETVGRTEAQVDGLRGDVGEIEEITRDHENRIQSLDRFRSKIIAYATVISFIFVSIFKLMA